MVQIVRSNKHIIIGIADDQVVNVDWSLLYESEFKDKNIESDKVKKIIIEYLQQAIRMCQQ